MADGFDESRCAARGRGARRGSRSRRARRRPRRGAARPRAPARRARRRGDRRSGCCQVSALVRAGAKGHRRVEQAAAELDPAADVPLDQIERCSMLASRRLRRAERHRASDATGSLRRLTQSTRAGTARRDRARSTARSRVSSSTLVHHVARIESRIHQVAAERRRVAALVRDEADRRLSLRRNIPRTVAAT